MSLIFVFALTLGAVAKAQAINFPVGFSGGVIRRIVGDIWLNISVAGVLAQERAVGPPVNPFFPSRYGGWGGMLGVGMRW